MQVEEEKNDHDYWLMADDYDVGNTFTQVPINELHAINSDPWALDRKGSYALTNEFVRRLSDTIIDPVVQAANDNDQNAQYVMDMMNTAQDAHDNLLNVGNDLKQEKISKTVNCKYLLWTILCTIFSLGIICYCLYIIISNKFTTIFTHSSVIA
eukprot:75964_1